MKRGIGDLKTIYLLVFSFLCLGMRGGPFGLQEPENKKSWRFISGPPFFIFSFICFPFLFPLPHPFTHHIIIRPLFNPTLTAFYPQHTTSTSSTFKHVPRSCELPSSIQFQNPCANHYFKKMKSQINIPLSLGL